MAENLKIGPTFPSELAAAGVSTDNLSWNVFSGAIVASDGAVHLAAAEAVLAKHDPTKTLVIVPEEISARQFFMQAVTDGDISEDEALGFVMGGTMPPSLATAIGQLPADQQFAAKMAFCGSTFLRYAALTPVIGQLFNKTSAQLDAFWTAASVL